MRNVTVRRVSAHDLAAARAARNPVFHAAAHWHEELQLALEVDDPARIARTIAEGSLLPFSPATRFELAVVMKLIAKLGERLAPHASWVCERDEVIATSWDAWPPPQVIASLLAFTR